MGAVEDRRPTFQENTQNLLKATPVIESVWPSLEDQTAAFIRRTHTRPLLAVLRVGHDPASILYIERKRETLEKCGMQVEEHAFPEHASQEDVIARCETLNHRDDVHGILLQLPLPASLDPLEIIAHIDPSKDVDGLHPFNRGLLFSQTPNLGIVPCTPWGCLRLLKHYGMVFQGKTAVIIGRSILVGRPLASLLLRENMTVIMTHSLTENLAHWTRQADLLCVAAGSPHLIRQEHITPKTWGLDIGIHRNEDRLIGDVDFEAVAPVVQAISPVPGGVGPMTRLGLVSNTLQLAYKRVLDETVNI